MLEGVDLTPILTNLVEIIGAVVGVFGIFVLTAARKWVNARTNNEYAEEVRRVEQNAREALNMALNHGVVFARNKLEEKKITFSRKNKIIDAAADYVVRSTPQALVDLGVTPERLRELLEARLYPEEDDNELAA